MTSTPQSTGQPTATSKAPRPPLRTLEGVKIVAFTQFLMGPAGVQHLADLGAAVVKVEPPRGAWERHWAGGDLYPGGESMAFLHTHRNVRSVALDLKQAAAQEAARRLVAGADVLVENFRPGVMDRLGLGYGQVRATNPRLVYVACSGYGENGPYRDLPGQDLLLQGLTGLANATGDEDGPPTPAGGALIDMHGAALLAMGTLAALLERERTGQGQLVEVTLAGAALDLQRENVAYALNGFPFGRGPRHVATGFHPAPYGVFETADGFIVVSMSPIAQINAALGLDELEPYEDPARRFPDRREISAILARVLKARPTAEWIEILRARDCWCAPVHDYPAAFADPAIQYLDPLVEIEHPTAGAIRVLKHPVTYGAGEPAVRRAPPLLGQHTAEVLRELGYTDAEIRTFISRPPEGPA
jgi:crotonobetainyl-CoA:carnitine CoA-transferase CaiB-like acyl-CoA transferase